ncbi:MAG: 4-phosphopantetheinyl transferase family protein, partial [Clostridium sp.]|nr:4-phosphopantetheinyl transferase family protein [Clostridium sp.]
ILFFRFWTLKESFMKATGLGFRLPLDAFSIIPGPEGVTLRQQVDSRQYYFREYDLQDGYRYALCSAEKPVGEAELTITRFRDLA